MIADHQKRSREECRQRVKRDGIERITVSFYRYVRLADPEAFAAALRAGWGNLGCFGRIYVASEGINAQMNVPRSQWDEFKAFNTSLPELAGLAYKVAVEEGNTPSFSKLCIRVREKIVADGLDDCAFDVTNTGAYLTAREFNEYVDDPDALIVDMRNAYESEIGHFENAITPDVDTFREELKVVPELLRGREDKRIALYCTGGIRCEKASAWLKHLGFANVRHLKGGIIDYKHQVAREGLPNRFCGKNFVFDERLGERIGDEIISTCHLCAAAQSDTHYHCAFEPCHALYLGCDDCVERRAGYCSRTCRLLDTLPAPIKKRYARYRGKRKPAHFKKHRLKLR